MTTKLLAGAALAALVLPAAAQAQSRTPGAIIIIVDRSRIAQTCTACVAASAALKGQADQLRARAQQLGAPLQTEGQSIQAAVNALPAGREPDPALKARITAFQQRQQAAQAELAGREETFGRNRNWVSKQVIDRLNPIVTASMKAHGANLAIDPQPDTILAYEPAIDVTGEVLAALNSQLPSVSTTAPAAPPAPAPTGR